jgi:trehalose 6-phosphate phosphatase
LSVAPERADAGNVTARLAPFAADPARSVVIVDFDGTLAPIVADPPAATPLPGAAAVLSRLVRRVGRLAVVSGRPVSFLQDNLPVDRLALFGHYGVERFDGTALSAPPQAQVWVDPIGAAAAEAEASLPGLFVERKGSLAVAFHWRRRADLEAAAIDLGRRLAATHGLRLQPGRQTLELRPPLDIDKGTTAGELADGASAALVMGDDRGDLAAFVALSRLIEERRLDHAVRVAVRSPESPTELLDHADLEVDGPAGALELLEDLADLLESA